MSKIYFYFLKSDPDIIEITEENNDSKASKCLVECIKQPNNVKEEEEREEGEED